ncbi:MAG TPA: FtsX-like permease family protein [Vicinamibacterales bacterium]|nr:FtsX-like permease family protein [Vicinamibacterales bacterium]
MPVDSIREWRALVRERVADLRLDPATEADVLDELAQHLQDCYRDGIARGIDGVAARAAALCELEGHPRLAREISQLRTMPMEPRHDESRSGWRALFDDGVFAVRRLRHSPGFAVVAIVTVMLTVGANTAILSVADAVLFRPLPYADPGQVAVIQMMNRKDGKQYTMTPYPFLQAVNDGCPSVGEVGLIETGPYLRFSRPDGQVQVATMEASPNYFQILGVSPAAGRLLGPQDAGGEGRAAVLTFSAWHQLFGGDPSVPGRSITLGSTTLDIVGVLPQGFVFPSVFAERASIVVLRKPLDGLEKGGTFHAIVRVARGITFERAQAEVDAATRGVAATVPDFSNSVPFLNPVRAILYPIGRPVMRYLLAASVLILLLGCANLANLLLVRGRRRLKETAVRLALGASRARLIRPIVIEALIVGAVGAGLAVLVTSWTFDLLIKEVPTAAYARAPVGVSTRVVAISMAMGLLASLLFSLIPAWRLAGVDVLALIQRRGPRSRRGSWLGRPMVGVQVAIAVAVVFGAAIATRSFARIANVDLGFQPADVVRIVTGPPQGETNRQDFFTRAIRAVAEVPGVSSAGVVGSLPFSRSAPNAGARLDGGAKQLAGIVYVLPGYFETVGIPVKRGRGLTWDVVQSDPDAALVSESAARVLFGDADPLNGIFTNGRDRRFHVIGVVGDVRSSYSDPARPDTYVFPGAAAAGLYMVARVRDHRAATFGDIKAALLTLNPSATPTIEWWKDQITTDPAYQDPRFQTIVFAALASLALGLTALGIFSVMSYAVSARSREMGVRLAIGASPASLVSLVVRQSLLPVSLGILAGLALAKWGGKLAEAQFFTVRVSDPLMLGLAVVTVLVASLLAAYLPARRATRINPTEVLRAE